MPWLKADDRKGESKGSHTNIISPETETLASTAFSFLSFFFYLTLFNYHIKDLISSRVFYSPLSCLRSEISHLQLLAKLQALKRHSAYNLCPSLAWDETVNKSFLRWLWTLAPHHKPLAWMMRGATALPSTPRAGWLPRLHSKVMQLKALFLLQYGCDWLTALYSFERMWFLASGKLKLCPLFAFMITYSKKLAWHWGNLKRNAEIHVHPCSLSMNVNVAINIQDFSDYGFSLLLLEKLFALNFSEQDIKPQNLLHRRYWMVICQTGSKFHMQQHEYLAKTNAEKEHTDSSFISCFEWQKKTRKETNFT